LQDDDDMPPSAAIYDQHLRDVARWALDGWVALYGQPAAEYLEREFRAPVRRLHDHELVEALALAMQKVCFVAVDVTETERGVAA